MSKCITQGLILHSELVQLRTAEAESENEIVMKEEKLTQRKKWLHLRLSEKEAAQIHRFRKETTHASLSEYTRHVLLQKPVVVTYRNRSLDDLLPQLIGLKNNLQEAQKTFGEAVAFLQKCGTVPEVKRWLSAHEEEGKKVQQIVAEILFQMNELYALWSQK